MDSRQSKAKHKAKQSKTQKQRELQENLFILLESINEFVASQQNKEFSLSLERLRNQMASHFHRSKWNWIHVHVHLNTNKIPTSSKNVLALLKYIVTRSYMQKTVSKYFVRSRFVADIVSFSKIKSWTLKLYEARKKLMQNTLTALDWFIKTNACIEFSSVER